MLVLPYSQQPFTNFQHCLFLLGHFLLSQLVQIWTMIILFFPYPNVSFFLLCAEAYIRKELSASSTSISLGPSSPERSSHRATAAPHQACSYGRLGSQKPPTKGLKSLPALQLFQGSGVRGRACFPLAHQQLALRLAAEAPFPLAEAQGCLLSPGKACPRV